MLGSNYVVGAHAVESLDPLSLVLLRWSLACLPLLALAQLIERPDRRTVLSAWRGLLTLAACGLLAYDVLLSTALQHVGALDAALINAFNPALITLAAAAFLQQRLTAARIGALMALSGVLIVLGRGQPTSLLTCAAAPCWRALRRSGALQHLSCSSHRYQPGYVVLIRSAWW